MDSEPQIHQDQSDKLGYISIILGLTIIFALPGFIVGLVGSSKAKISGGTPMLSRIGWMISLFVLIVSSTFLILWLKNVPVDMQNEIKDITSKYELQKIKNKLESFYLLGHGYPGDLTALNISQDELTDANGKPYKYLPKDCQKPFQVSLGESSPSSKMCTSYTIIAKLSSTNQNFVLKSTDISQLKSEVENSKRNADEKIEKNNILEKVSKKLTKPLVSNEYQVAIIQNADLLKSIKSNPNPYRTVNVENGDISITYSPKTVNMSTYASESDRLILYRKSSDKVLYDGPYLAKKSSQ